MRHWGTAAAALGALILLALAAAVHFGKEPSAEDERARLAGVWEVVSTEAYGHSSEYPGCRYEFKGEEFRIIPDRREASRWRAYKLNVAPSPRQIDWPVRVAPADGPPFEVDCHGIYRIERDVLRIALPLIAGGLRPNAFHTAPGYDQQNPYEVLTLKRFDPAAKPTAEALAKRREAAWYAAGAVIDGGDVHRCYLDFSPAFGGGGKVSDRLWDDLVALGTAASLRAHGCPGLADANMRRVASLVSLEKLDLSCTPVGDAGVAELRALPKLQRLDLSFSQVTDAAIDVIAHLPALKAVDLTGTQITADGINRLSTPRPDLGVAWTRAYSSEQQKAAAALGQMKLLIREEEYRGAGPSVPACRVTLPAGPTVRDPSVPAPPEAVKREPVHWVEPGAANLDLAPVANCLQKLPAPITVAVSDYRMDDSIFVLLRNAPGLIELKLARTLVSDAGLAELKRHRELKVLDVSFDRLITDVGLAHIAALPALENLNIGGTSVTGNGLALLLKLERLKTLTVSETNREVCAKLIAKGVYLTVHPPVPPRGRHGPRAPEGRSP